MKKIIKTAMLITFCLLQTVAWAEKVDYKNWMGNLPASRRLSTLSIPCAHDAATWSSNLDWACDQKYCEGKLWNMGVRFFDLRIGNGYHFYHGSDKLKSFENEMSYFPDSLRKECMFLYLNFESGHKKDDYKDVFCDIVSRIYQRFGSDDKTFVRFRKDMTLGDVRGKIIILADEKDCDSTLLAGQGMHIPVGYYSPSYNAKFDDSYVTYNNEDPLLIKYQNCCAPSMAYNSRTKMPYVYDGFEKYWQLIDDDNTENIFNFAGLNGYNGKDSHDITAIVGLGGISVAGDDWIVRRGHKFDKGVNHLTWEFLSNAMIKPFGFVYFDFCGAGTAEGYSCHGDDLLNCIIDHNYFSCEFIKELAIATCSKESQVPAEKLLKEKGYKLVGPDNLNYGTSGRPVILGYKTTKDPAEAITDVVAYNKDSSRPEKLHLSYQNFVGDIYRDYYPTQGFSTVEGENYNGDTNIGNGTWSDWIYIFSSHTHSYDRRKDKELLSLKITRTSTAFGSPSNSVIKTNGSNNMIYSAPCDFNEDAGGPYTWMSATYHKHMEEMITKRYDSKQHFNYCEGCGKKLSDNGYMGEHKFNASNLANGLHAKECSVCDYYETGNCESDAYENGIGTCTLCGGIAFQPAVMNDSVYEISNAGQLYWYANEVNLYGMHLNASLKADIDLTNVSAPWIPIGVVDSVYINALKYREDSLQIDLSSLGIGYNGTFDGQGHVIKGIKSTYNSSVSKCNGLFGYVHGGTVKNLGLIDCQFIDGYYLGALAGEANDAKFENVYSSAKLQKTSGADGAKYILMGGLIGRAHHTSLTNGYFNGTMTGGTYTALPWLDYGNCEVSNFYADKNYSSRDREEVTIASAEDFASGRLCYLLNNSRYEGNIIWRQNLGDNGEAETLPCLDSSHDVVVPAKYNGRNFIGLDPNVTEDRTPYGMKKVADYQIKNLTLEDGYDYYIPVAFCTHNASTKRYVPGRWGTVCLPFNIKSNDTYQLYTVSDAEESDKLGTIHLVPITELNANTPAIFYKTADVDVVEFKNADNKINVIGTWVEQSTRIAPPDDNTYMTDGSGNILTLLHGTFEKENVGNEGPNYALYIANDKLWSLDGKNTLTVNPFRAWISFWDKNIKGPSALPTSITIDKSQSEQMSLPESMEVVNSIDNDDLVIDASELDIPMYDASGRRVLVPQNGQIVIKHGKKIIYNK